VATDAHSSARSPAAESGFTSASTLSPPPFAPSLSAALAQFALAQFAIGCRMLPVVFMEGRSADASSELLLT